MRDVVSTDDWMSSGSDLEMRPSRRNDTPMVVGVDEYSNSHSFNHGEDIGEHEEQVRDNLVAIQIPRG